MKTLLKIALYCIYLSVTVFLLGEFLLRIYFAYEITPRVLLYGTDKYENTFGADRQRLLEEQYDKEITEWEKREQESNTVYHQDREMGGYRKFFPNEEKYHRDAETGELFRIKINSRGFRGEDFVDEKQPNVVRILTLGASSTFGFFNRDHQTYPYQLQQLLEKDCPPVRFEVINFAIPKATADNIRTMLIAEGIKLKPDILTFYEGRNDSDKVHPMEFKGTTDDQNQSNQGTWYYLSRKLLLFRLADQLLFSHTKISGERVRKSLETVASRTSREFIGDLEQIRKLASMYNIHLIIANQQASSQSWFQVPIEQRKKMRGFSYGQEAGTIENLLANGQSISGYEFNFLIHRRLMKDLEQWASKNQLPFIDIIELLDGERDHLVSYVHLDSYANGIVAQAFASEIMQGFECAATADSGN